MRNNLYIYDPNAIFSMPPCRISSLHLAFVRLSELGGWGRGHLWMRVAFLNRVGWHFLPRVTLIQKGDICERNRPLVSKWFPMCWRLCVHISDLVAWDRMCSITWWPSRRRARRWLPVKWGDYWNSWFEMADVTVQAPFHSTSLRPNGRQTLDPRPLFTPNRSVGHAILDYFGAYQWCRTCVFENGSFSLPITSKESQLAIQFFHYKLPLFPVQLCAVSRVNIFAKPNKFPFPMILVWDQNWVNVAR